MQIENVADLVAETLIQAGVKRIFGVVGDSLNGLTEALRKRKTIRLDTCPARGSGGLRRRRRSANYRRARGMRRLVWSG